ncbi:hypothetical protein L1N85_19635 [Paenibacillus alkaliterrae]|uniref:hypothetical protein n=1 Tax=Paenibacillus alkaliterrae TaxID=320909 RepID=UPI001F4665F1|nr:hypothetical protein [Paenibacillus alkaliterrae]MCF2940609.1 hypothetical protein [Paenibacillus alkaliterrae]
MENKSNFCPICGSELNSPVEPANIKTSAVMNGKKEKQAKKAPTAYMFGLIGMFLSVIIALGGLSLADFEFYSFSLWFVIPVGGIAFGMITTSVYCWRIVNKGYKPSRKNYLVSLVMVLITFFFIQYGEYQITYVTDDNEVNHQFTGDHISNFMDEDDNVLTFNNYFAYKLKNSESSLMYRGSEISEIDSSTGYNLFSWSLNLVGFLLGGLFSVFLSTQGKTHCMACKRAYVTEHRLGEMSSGKVVELQKLVQAIESNNFNTFIDIINRCDIFNNNDSEAQEESYIIKIGACPNCKHGYIIMRNYSPNGQGEYNENENKKIVLPITGSFATKALSFVEAA